MDGSAGNGVLLKGSLSRGLRTFQRANRSREYVCSSSTPACSMIQSLLLREAYWNVLRYHSGSMAMGVPAAASSNLQVACKPGKDLRGSISFCWWNRELAESEVLSFTSSGGFLLWLESQQELYTVRSNLQSCGSTSLWLQWLCRCYEAPACLLCLVCVSRNSQTPAVKSTERLVKVNFDGISWNPIVPFK